jgi:DNA-binding beta-propeller fold protein YncE
MGYRIPMRMLAGVATIALIAACSQAAAPSPAAPTTTPSSTPAKAPVAYKQVGTINITPKDTESFDVLLIDPKTHALYVADRTTKGVDVIVNEKFVTTVGGMVGVAPKSADSGPNGLVLVPDMNQIWAGDGDSTIKVVDLKSNTVTATIKVGGKHRTDEGAYDPKDKIVMFANDSDDPPFVTFVSATDQKILGKLEFPGADGLEESFFDDSTGMFWLSVPKSKDNKEGAVVQIDPKAMKVTKTYPEKGCESNGIAPGPNSVLLLVCNGDAINDGFKASTQFMDLKTGTIVGSVPAGGGDLAVYDDSTKSFLVADSNMTSDGTKSGTAAPAVTVIDGSKYSILQQIPTAKSAHSIAIDTSNHHIYVPVPGKGIWIFAAQ